MPKHWQKRGIWPGGCNEVLQYISCFQQSLFSACNHCYVSIIFALFYQR